MFPSVLTKTGGCTTLGMRLIKKRLAGKTRLGRNKLVLIIPDSQRHPEVMPLGDSSSYLGFAVLLISILAWRMEVNTTTYTSPQVNNYVTCLTGFVLLCLRAGPSDFHESHLGDKKDHQS